MADQEYNVKITTTGSSAGADAVAGSLNKVVVAAERAGGENKKLGREAENAAGLLDQFGRRGAAAHDVVEGLTRATEGGVSGLLGLAKAAYNAREALAISGFGLVIGVILGLAPALIELAKKFTDAGEAAKDGADKATKAFGEEKTAAEKLNEIRLEAFQRELAAIADESKNALANLQDIYGWMGKVAQASEAMELAKVESDSSLSADEKARRSGAIKASYRGAAVQRESDLSVEQLGVLNQEAGRTRAVAFDAARERDRQQALLSANRQAPEDRAIVAKELLRQIADIMRDEAARGLGGMSDGKDIAALAQQRQALQEQLKYIQARDAVADSPLGKKDATAAEKRATDAEAMAKKAEADSRAADAALKAALEKERIRRENAPHVLDLENEAARIPQTAADIAAISSGKIPAAYRERILSSAMDAGAGRLSAGHNMIPGRLSAAFDDASKIGAETGGDMAKAVADSLTKHFGAVTPAFRRYIDDAVKMAADQVRRDLEDQIKATRR